MEFQKIKLVVLYSAKGRILIVDDNRSLLMVLGMTLRNAGYEVHTAGDGWEGLQKFESGPWDLIVTDRDMPLMDGEQMAAEMKALSPGIPVILVTGILSGVANPSLFASVHKKPYEAAVILAAVAAVSNRYADERQYEERSLQ